MIESTQREQEAFEALKDEMNSERVGLTSIGLIGSVDESILNY